MDCFDINEKPIVWIALNPSTADEKQLDPTLTRIKNFSIKFGFNCFYMLNLFAFRSTNPQIMINEKNPIGKDNNYWIKKICSLSNTIVCCWGNHGKHLNRSVQIKEILNQFNLLCLDLSKNNQPKHPLYLNSNLNLKPFYF